MYITQKTKFENVSCILFQLFFIYVFIYADHVMLLYVLSSFTVLNLTYIFAPPVNSCKISCSREPVLAFLNFTLIRTLQTIDQTCILHKIYAGNLLLIYHRF